MPISLLDDLPDPRARDDGRADDWFALGDELGFGRANRRADAIRLEGLLAGTGDLDLAATDGPTGYWGARTDAALRRLQKRAGLAVDGWVRPDGPTIRHLRGELGDAFAGHVPPGPGDVDAHHDARARGLPGTLAWLADATLAPIDGLPDIGAAGRASNDSQLDWLARNQAGLGNVPAQLARYVAQGGADGLAQARDFVERHAARHPADSGALVAGILRELPDDEARRRFLGRAPGRQSPMWTMELRPGEADPRGAMQFAAEAKAETPDAAPAPDVPAYRADVFRGQEEALDTMRKALAGDPARGAPRRLAYESIFVAEGGMRPAPENGAVAGIRKSDIDAERKNGTWPADLAHVRKPADLRAEDVPRAMDHYFDRAFPKIGGAAALDTIPDPKVAAAVADTLYREGTDAGTRLVQQALETAGRTTDVDGVFGSRTLQALREAASGTKQSMSFLDALAERRIGREDNRRERPRFEFYRFGSQR